MSRRIPQRVRDALRERAGGCCEICGLPANNAHHRRNQSQGGEDVLSNLMLVCGSGTTGCHGTITRNPNWAEDRGYTIKGSQAVPAHVPVQFWFGAVGRDPVWFLLDDDGGLHQKPDRIARLLLARGAHHFVTQEVLHDPAAGTVGDCWRAGIASVVGVPLAGVPHFVRDYPDPEGATEAAWFAETCRWLTAHHGVTALFYDNPEQVRAERRLEESAFPHILIDGRSPRDVAHVCVGDAITGEILHDPHPTRAGLATVTGAFVLVEAQ